MPRRSISPLDGVRPLLVDPKLGLEGLIGCGLTILDSGSMTRPTVSSAGGASALGSYPSFSIRSCSSFAFFSASSKSRALASIFFAPSFFFAPRMLVFFAPPAVAVFRTAAAGTARGAAAESAADNGDLLRPPLLPFAFKKGEAVRLMPGVFVRDGTLLGLLIVGLSHEEKKSSSVSRAGVPLPPDSDSSIASVMTTSVGYLG